MGRPLNSLGKKLIWLTLVGAGVIILIGFPWFWRLYYPLPYRQTIFTQAQAAEVDPYLVMALIRVESKFRPQAESRMGARGLMQLMPETAEWVTKQLGEPYSVEGLFEIEYNVRIGCWYLANLLKEFEGNLPLALAAYNGGRGNVRQWVNQGLWAGDEDHLEKIPFTETRDFIQRVLQDYEMYRRIYA